jgi:hypothetical protein
MSVLEPRAASPKPKRPWPISRNEVVTALLVLNLFGLIGLGVRVYRGDKPAVVTVGITQMARDYMAKLATSNVSPQEARIRTQLFLAVAQDAVKQAASRKGILVVPRECVLAGEYTDMTAEVARAVGATMDRRATSGGAAAPAAALPAAGGIDAAP